MRCLEAQGKDADKDGSGLISAKELYKAIIQGEARENDEQIWKTECKNAGFGTDTWTWGQRGRQQKLLGSKLLSKVPDHSRGHFIPRGCNQTKNVSELLCDTATLNKKYIEIPNVTRITHRNDSNLQFWKQFKIRKPCKDGLRVLHGNAKFPATS